MSEVAVIGFGFSGLMVVANLVRTHNPPRSIYIVAETLDGLGVAYSSSNTQHLLNVVADKMGAFADEADGFTRWLNTPEAALAKQRMGLSAEYAASDFVPRMLYGAYLQHIWRETQTQAAQKNIALKHVPSTTVAIQRAPLAVLTARCDAIAVAHIVIATGNENKPIAVPPGTPIIQDPWGAGALDGVAQLASPVLLIGTGLTAVDTILSLRANGYRGEIIAASLRGLWPKPHAASAPYHFERSELLAQKNLRALVRCVRMHIAQHTANGGNWRAVIDALRPHSQVLWQRATTADRQRFFRHLMTYWSTHRHRMAPVIAASIEAEIAAGMLRSIPRSKLSEVIANHRPSRVYNCTGPQIDVRRSREPLWQQLVAEGLAEPHETGLGVATDPQFRAWGLLHPNLAVIGTPMTGQWLESTAVPELRSQAAAIAQALCLLNAEKGG